MESPGSLERLERIVMALKEADRMLMALYDPERRCPEPHSWESEKRVAGHIRKIHLIISQSIEELEYLQYSISRLSQSREAG